MPLPNDYDWSVSADEIRERIAIQKEEWRTDYSIYSNRQELEEKLTPVDTPPTAA